jgi:hypothetical protein
MPKGGLKLRGRSLELEHPARDGHQWYWLCSAKVGSWRNNERQGTKPPRKVFRIKRPTAYEAAEKGAGWDAEK